MSWDLIVGIASIIVINVVLSGDNAVVIAMASHRLVPRLRRWAIILGGGGAIVLRILFTIPAIYFLRVPFLQAVGGVVLTWIAYKLLRDEGEEHVDIQAKASLVGAVQTIVLADLVMSLDNILAIGGAAHGSIKLLLFGLVVSMPPILFGSSLIARLMNRLPWLILVGSVVLTITAARMVVDDRLVDEALSADRYTPVFIALALVFTLSVLVPTLLQRRARRREREREVLVGAQTRQADRPSGG